MRGRKPDVEKLLTVAEVAAILSVHPRTVYRMVQTGEIPAPVKVGRGTRFVASEIEAMILELKGRRSVA